MTQSKEIVIAYLNKQESFTWVADIANQVLYGFKGSRFKSFKRACTFVQKIMDELEKEGKVVKEEYLNRKPIYYICETILK